MALSRGTTVKLPAGITKSIRQIRSNPRMKAKFILLLVGLAYACSAHAGIILSDSFSYPDGAVTEAPGSPWVAHSGAGNGPVQIIGGQLRVTGGSAEDVNALLAGGPYLSNSVAVLYSSFKMRVTSQPGAAGTYIAHFKDTNSGAATGFGGRVWVNNTNAYTGAAVSNNQFRIGIGNGTSASSLSGQINQDLFLSTNYLIVTRFVPNTGLATIWVNPTAESDPSVTATDPGTAARPNPIDVVAYSFRQASGQGTIFVDDLRVGTTFNDVAGPNNPPTISGIGRQNTAAGVPTGPIAFTIGDVETPAAALTVTGASSDQSLVPDANIIIAGTGANRTVTITPAAGQQGTNTITMTVADDSGGVATASFILGVGVPTISNIPNVSTPADRTLSVDFTIGDTETSANGLTVTASSGNQTLLPDGSIQIAGTGAQRTLSLSPSPGQSGLATITVTVSDGISISSDTFVLTVNPLLGLLRSDNFDRPDAPLIQFDGLWLSNGGTGGTSIQQMLIKDGRLQVTSDQSEDCSTELPPGQLSTPTYLPASGTIFYVGMKINYQRLPPASGGYFAHFRDGNNGFRARIYAATFGTSAGHYRLGIANSANTITSPAMVATELATNQSYAVVIRYNAGTGESRLWLDPASESSDGVNAVDGAQPITVEAFTFRQNSDIGTVLVDDLKIGTSFSDVAEARYSLAIVGAGDDVQIFWAKAARDAGYKLQANGGLDPAGWSDVSTDLISEQSDQLVVRFFDVTENRFFRLIK